MEVNSLQSADMSSYSTNVNPVVKVPNQNDQSTSNDKEVFQEEKEITKEKLQDSIGEMNKAMEALNSTIRFSLHEKTGRLIVQVVDQDRNEVIKEFPPKEFLDTQAKIREYIGMLLDIKA